MPAPTHTNLQVTATMHKPVQIPQITLQFLSNAKHRTHPTPDASIWYINLTEEYNCFESSDVDPTRTVRWGHCNRDPLGWSIRTRRNRHSLPDLIYAKFICDENSQVWHGYPADYVANTQDIPHDDFLTISLNLNKAKMRKIKNGKSI